MTARPDARYVGVAVERTEDARLLVGRGRYVDDVAVPGMLHAAFSRSPVAHGRIRSIDTTRARAADGVVAVLTGEDVQRLIVPGPVFVTAILGGPELDYTLLCTDKVLMVGDPIAVVVARTRAQAEDACELIEINIDELPVVASARSALDPAMPPIFEDLGSNVLKQTEPAVYGDIDAAFGRADRVIRAEIRQHRHQHVPIECRGIVADFDPATGCMTVHSASQGVHLVRSTIAQRLGLAGDRVRVLTADVGGSFGLKPGNSREEVAVAAVAKFLGRPVKWIEDRNDNLVASGQAREETFAVEAAVTDDGDILGLKVRMTLDSGSYPAIGWLIGSIMEPVMPGPYKLEAFSFAQCVAVTNKASYTAYRAPWAGETFVRERTFDLIARELGIDPFELRLRNVVTRGEAPLHTVTGVSLVGVTARESLERVAEVVDFRAFRAHQEHARAHGRYVGIGVATHIEMSPGPKGARNLLAEVCRARLEPDGTVVVVSGQTPHGQSHETTLAQVAADEMGVPYAQVRIQLGDSDVVPTGYTGGSRSAVMAGGATRMATRRLRERVLAVAAELLEANVADLEILDGSVAVKGVPASAIPIAEVARAVAEGRLPPGTDAHLEVEIDFDGGEGGWTCATHCAEVEVDVDTGLVRVVRYVVANDCGEVINPAIVEGQIRGAVAQGIGAVLLEWSAYDENGQYLCGSLMDYLVPTANDVPRIGIEHLETVPLDPDVNFRGIGEGGMVVAPATICSAIEDALGPFGVRIREQHLPPTRILELIGSIAPMPGPLR
jgi:carbon-monoxide dehydrogenase large subunit